MIAITGISGYIGFHLAYFLREKQKKCVGLIKKQTAQADIEALNDASIAYTLVDFFDEQNMYDALEGVTEIVHLIGSIYQPKQMSMESLHKDITGVLVKAAQRRGIKRIVYVSALGSSLQAHSMYHKTKAQAEEQIKASGIPYVILRPSLIFGKQYGRRNSKLIARMADTISNGPVIPLIGSGRNTLQPVHVMELAEAIDSALTMKPNDKTIEVGGPDIMTFEQIARTIATAVGCEQKKTLHIPRPIARVLAVIMEQIADQPKITRDQVIMTKNDNVCTSDQGSVLFPFITTRMQDCIDSLL